MVNRFSQSVSLSPEDAKFIEDTLKDKNIDNVSTFFRFLINEYREKLVNPEYLLEQKRKYFQQKEDLDYEIAKIDRKLIEIEKEKQIGHESLGTEEYMITKEVSQIGNRITVALIRNFSIKKDKIPDNNEMENLAKEYMKMKDKLELCEFLKIKGFIEKNIGDGK